MKENIIEESAPFLALLRSGLWNNPIPNSIKFGTNTNWNQIFKYAKQQTVFGLVADAILRLTPTQQPIQNTLLELNYIISTTIRQHALLNDAIAKITNILKTNNINSILLKGQGLAANYPKPYLRQCGDIDLYIGETNYTKTCKLFNQQINANSEATESIKHYHTNFNGVTVELHRIAEQLFNPIYNLRFQHWSQEQLLPIQLNKEDIKSIIINQTTVLLPPVTFNALYIFNHIWHHFFSGGIGLRQLCDLAIHLHTYAQTIDRPSLQKNLKRFGLLKPWKIFGCILVEYLGLPETEFPFYDSTLKKQAAKALQQILTEGNFGKYSPILKTRPKGYFAGKIHSIKRITSRISNINTISPKDAIIYYLYFIITGTTAVIKRK